MFTIRLARTEDKEAISELYTALAGQQISEDDWEYAMGTGGVVVAEKGEGIIGFGGIDVSAEVQLKWLYVLPGYQRFGIGSEILKRLERVGWRYHLTSLRLHSTPKAVDFYRKHGYRLDEASSAYDHAGIGMVKDRPSIFLNSLVPRSEQLGKLRDGFLVMAGIFYLFGYLVWALNANQNNLGLVPALEFQYFVAGIVPVAILSIIILLVRGYLRIRSKLQSWLSPRATGTSWFFRILITVLWFVSLIFLYVSFTDWFERFSGGFLAYHRLGILPVLLFTILTLLLPPDDPRTIVGASIKDNLLRIVQGVLVFSILGRIYAFALLITFPLFGFIFFVQSVYPRIPQEFGGARPRVACLDMVKAQLSTQTLTDLGTGSGVTGDPILRSSQVEVLYSGGGVMVVRKAGRVFEIKREAVQAITTCN